MLCKTSIKKTDITVGVQDALLEYPSSAKLRIERLCKMLDMKENVIQPPKEQ